MLWIGGVTGRFCIDTEGLAFFGFLQTAHVTRLMRTGPQDRSLEPRLGPDMFGASIAQLKMLVRARDDQAKVAGAGFE